MRHSVSFEKQTCTIQVAVCCLNATQYWRIVPCIQIPGCHPMFGAIWGANCYPGAIRNSTYIPAPGCCPMFATNGYLNVAQSLAQFGMQIATQMLPEMVPYIQVSKCMSKHLGSFQVAICTPNCAKL